MNSPPSRKRNSSGEPFALKSPKICKVDISVKENTPPEVDVSNNLSNSGRITPKKCTKIKDEPITPNANIKLLTSLAASLDYANICNTPKSAKSEENCIEYSNEEDIILDSTFKPSRKEKSLALVCFKFLTMYPLDPDPKENIVVSLHEASWKLKVERRRLYDIINVFESIEMLSKVAKNHYIWYGRRFLLRSLNSIKNSAVCEGIARKFKYVQDVESSSNYQRQSCILDEVQDFSKRLDRECESVVKELLTPTFSHPEVRKEKSLAAMSQKFLMLFLVSPTKVVSLGEAAKVLNGFQTIEKGAQIKTQIRRLYDIANVLSSINLIKKQVIKSANGKKPAFKYVGPDADSYSSKETVLMNSFRKIKPKSLIRHSSFQEICEVAELEHQKLCLEETPNSAPPFENSLGKGPHCVNFNINSKNDSTSNGLRANYVFSNAKKSVPKPAKIPIARTVKAQIPTLAKRTIFVINHCSLPIKQSRDEENKKNSAKTSQTIELSPAQRDNILKSLNISLTPGQVAAIQLAGSTQSFNTTPNNQCNVLKIIDNGNKISSVELKQQDLFKDVSAHNNESDKSSTANSSRNSSPVSQTKGIYSPLSIPSGYTTPIPSSMSDITSFPSNSEVDSILKKIENRNDVPVIGENIKKHEGMLQSFRNCVPIKGMPLSRHNSDSCSSESLNAEVTNILKEVPLGATATASRPHSFLIDEKTILSPIKKPNGCAKILSPSPLMTPPYISSDAIFLYQPFIKLQNTASNKLESSLLKLENDTVCDKKV
ncbi:transcription factor E2F8 isoform X2 [Parasteatoda tepidariorum]|uniref:transcription factor E2F8 isoform X2 n=1 Tax=Parasteatoda tepidariorum TaxID=114398 RepID=UPI001C7294FB|nr:transcription factor E2F8 isoform X2 [Parasteatoda tepidariorum]